MDDRKLIEHIAEYARHLDDVAPPVESLAPATDEAPVARIDDARIERRRRTAWLTGLGAAALVAIVVGSIAVVDLNRTPTEPPATTPPASVVDPTRAVLVQPDPVLDPETSAVEDLVFFTMGDVVEVDGVLHSLLGAETKPISLYHATSQDGTSWEIDPAPVDAGDPTGLMTLRATELIQVDDGSWVGYFDLGRDLGEIGNHIYRWWIHRGTAPSIDGPWTIDPDPVLDAGPPGSWDDAWVRNASVIRNDDGWRMFYLGGVDRTDDSFGGSVGVATSPDGITWAKSADPVFVGDPEIRFEGGLISKIEVKPYGEGLLLTYGGATGGTRGIAQSLDGVVWVRDLSNPVLTPLDVGRGSIYDTAMWIDGSELQWFVVGGGYESQAVYEMYVDGLEPMTDGATP